VNEFASNVERHRRELLLHCYRMLGSLPDAEDAVQEALLRAWRYRDSLKEGAPLRPWLYRVATNACLDAIARDERRAVLAARAAADDGWTGKLEDVVWLGPIPNSVLEPTTPPARTPEAMTLIRETIEIAFLTVIQLLTPQQRAALILCDVLDWSAKDAADLLELSVPAVNSALQRARVRLRCVVTHANLQPAVAAYVCRPGDSTWRAMALDVLRIEDGLITEIVVFMPEAFPAFGLPMVMDAPPEVNQCH
jgi:RNA polymerase sigma-70 factor, ECF subfamily